MSVKIIKNHFASHTKYWIFFSFLLTRVGFKYLSGFDNFQLFYDSSRYDMLSNRILNGNFNLDVTAFITAPFYPWVLAGIKYVFGEHWQFFVILFQFLMVSLSGVFLYKIGLALFKKEKIGILAAFVYCIFPMTLWYNFTFTQETLFQSFFIIFIYYFLGALKGRKKDLILAAILFSISFLVKSHILLFSPFIALTFLLSKDIKRVKGFIFASVFTFICLGFTLPNGLYNLKENGIYTLSSCGASTFFHNGNSEYTYQETFNPPDLESDSFIYGSYLDFIFNPEFDHPKYGKINKLPHTQKQPLHRKMAINWIKNNPEKFWQMKRFAFYRFFTPGVSLRHYSFYKWLAVFVVSFPVYLLAYIGVFWAVRKNVFQHIWMVFLMFSIFLFFMIFSPQARFRMISLEPLYILYASFAFFEIKSYYKKRITNS